MEYNLKDIENIKQKAILENIIETVEKAYQVRLKWFEILNKVVEPGGVVFLGDSITEHFLVNDMFATVNLYNRGISGDTTVGILKRLKESVFDLKPKKVFLMIGTNDLGLKVNNSNGIVQNIEKIINEIRANVKDVEIYLESIYPIYEGEYDKEFAVYGYRNNKNIDKTNVGLKSLSEKLGITYLDINSILKGEDGNIKLEYTREGLHISPVGYEVVKKCIEEYL